MDGDLESHGLNYSTNLQLLNGVEVDRSGVKERSLETNYYSIEESHLSLIAR